MIWVTGGQHKEPMVGALAYAVTKGALHQMTDTVANLVDFLLSDAGAWIRGQVIDSEGGFDWRR